MTPIYPLAANIRQIRYRYHSNSGFLCKFNTFASLLGGQVTSETASDFNSYTEVKKVYVSTDADSLNKPITTIAVYGGLLEVKKAYGNRLIQTFTLFNENRTFQRLRADTNNWTAWKEITMTS